MKLKILEMGDTRAKILLTNTRPSLANALRRTLTADLPKMAIEDVEFHLGPISDERGKTYESITPLFDEIIAHRLGLLPIPTDIELFSYRDKCESCSGEGCPNCTILYNINKKGPCTIYSEDLQLVTQKIKGIKAKKYEDKFKIKDSAIPIVKLGEGQALLVYATAILGTGKEHAKWKVAHGAGYKYYPIINIDNEKCDRCESCIESCPHDIFKLARGKIAVKNIEDCTLCKACVDACERKAIEVEGDETKILFQFETDGSWSAKDALKYSLTILENKFTEFGKAVSKLK